MVSFIITLPKHDFKVRTSPFDSAILEKGYTDKYGWTVLGTTDKKTQDPLGYMLDHISLTTDQKPTLAEAKLWFYELIPLIAKCYAGFD